MGLDLGHCYTYSHSYCYNNRRIGLADGIIIYNGVYYTSILGHCCGYTMYMCMCHMSTVLVGGLEKRTSHII